MEKVTNSMILKNQQNIMCSVHFQREIKQMLLMIYLRIYLFIYFIYNHFILSSEATISNHQICRLRILQYTFSYFTIDIYVDIKFSLHNKRLVPEITVIDTLRIKNNKVVDTRGRSTLVFRNYV